MQKIKILLTLGMFFLLIKPKLLAQNTFPNLTNCNTINSSKYKKKDDRVFKLLIISGAGCGYCDITLESIYKNKLSNKINVVVVEFGNEEYINKIHGKYFEEFKFINGSKCKIKGIDDDFFPLLYLYKNEKLVWKRKGWYKSNIKKIEKAINNGHK
ncbi:MAG: hypothetical protein QGH06_04225 [Lutibacter sp.]|jgi:hypothetical protein|nr:hypothetical protein [Lutibacter sp.]